MSFETPEYTANSDAVGALRLLEAIRILKLKEKMRFYQASTFEFRGLVEEVPQRESTPFSVSCLITRAVSSEKRSPPARSARVEG